EVIFQSPIYETELVNRKVISIVHQTLTVGSVLFAFLLERFVNQVQTYKAIISDLNPVKGF
ncbi:hypothetical protein BD560DRAFT_330552, partial [Blakeslea trispora]